MIMWQDTIKVTVTDNGYVLEWRKPNNKYQGMWPQQELKTEGVEVFTNQGKLLARIKSIL